MTRNAACPNSMELTRCVFEGAGQTLRKHLEECPACAKEAAATRALAELGRELPDGSPSEESAEAVRRALLAASSNETPRAGGARRRYWIPIAAAASIALAVGVILFASGPFETHPQGVAAGETRRASVHAQKGADHVLLGAQPDEMVRLTDGTITVEVAKLRAGERFRVVTGDAEVEVRGTAFDVTAKDDALVGVRVLSGKVEVRPAGRAVALLGPGEHWDAPVARGEDGVAFSEAVAAQPETSQGEVAPARVALDQAVNRPGTAAADASDTGAGLGASISPAEAAFNAGWEALRLGKPAVAAALFGQAADLGSGESILEDAVFWRAVALDRAGQRGPAADGMRNFLQRFPSSVRRGEVSVMLGWKVLQGGDPAGAKALFDSALGDRVPWVRASATSGVSEAGRR